MACNTSSKNGVLIKNPEILEIAYKIKNIVLDKTGTLTENKLEIVKTIEYKDDFKQVIASLEADSNHPIANAIKESYKDKKITFDSIIQVSGEGIIGKVNNDEYYAGNEILLSKHNIKLDNQIQFAIENNYSYIGVGKNNELLGIIYLQDKIKIESYKAIDNLKTGTADWSNAVHELNDEVLKLVTGGNFVFDYSQCPCGRFRPYNGNPNNQQYSNCLYFVTLIFSNNALCTALDSNTSLL